MGRADLKSLTKRSQSLRAWPRLDLTGKVLLAIMVLATLYMGVLASDRYVSEARIYIKQSGQTLGGSSAFSILGAPGPGENDMRLVKEFIHSTDLIEVLDTELNLSEHYQSSDRDIISRLPRAANFDQLTDYYRAHVDAEMYDGANVLTIKVQGFTPEFARETLALVLEESENFINRVGRDVALSEIAFIEEEVRRARDELERAEDVLLKFQGETGVLQAEANGQAAERAVIELEARLVNERTDLRRLSAFLTNEAPDIIASKGRVEAIERQLAFERQTLTKDGDASPGRRGAELQRVVMSVTFSRDLYQAALTGLETAKADANHKLKHLIVVQSPGVAQEASYPRRLYNLATLFVVLLLLYGIISMITATIREHRDFR